MVVAAQELARVCDPPIGRAHVHLEPLLLEVLFDGGQPITELVGGDEPDPLREQRGRGLDEAEVREEWAPEVVEEHAVVPEVGHRRVADVDGEVHGHLRDVARSERRVRGHDARNARLRFDLLSELDGLRPEADGELEADGLRLAALDNRYEPVGIGHRWEATARCEKYLSLRVPVGAGATRGPPRRPPGLGGRRESARGRN